MRFPRNSTSTSARIVFEDTGKLSLCCGCSRRQWVLNCSSTGSGDEQSGQESEDSLQATIRKSKKVLAMQKDLLDQVLLSLLTFTFLWSLRMFFRMTAIEF